MDEAQILAALRSRNLEQQLPALDEAIRIVKALVTESVRTLANAEAGFPLASQLFRFGPVIIPLLIDLLDQPISDEGRNHAASLLVEHGSPAGVPDLLALLRNHDRNAVMAALVLSKAKVQEAAPLIIDILQDWDCAADPYPAMSFMLALNRLEALPDTLKESIRGCWPDSMKAAFDTL